jgi:hypothetical protein
VDTQSLRIRTATGFLALTPCFPQPSLKKPAQCLFPAFVHLFSFALLHRLSFSKSYCFYQRYQEKLSWYNLSVYEREEDAGNREGTLGEDNAGTKEGDEKLYNLSLLISYNNHKLM